MNMAVLWNLGRVVEPMLGRVHYLVLYLLSALGGSVLVLLIAPEDPWSARPVRSSGWGPRTT